MATPAISANVRFKTLCLRAEAMFVCLRSEDGRELMLPMHRCGRAIWALDATLPPGVYHYHFGRQIDGRLAYHRPFDARVPVGHGQSARLEVMPGAIGSVRRHGPIGFESFDYPKSHISPKPRDL